MHVYIPLWSTVPSTDRRHYDICSSVGVWIIIIQPCFLFHMYSGFNYAIWAPAICIIYKIKCSLSVAQMVKKKKKEWLHNHQRSFSV